MGVLLSRRIYVRFSEEICWKTIRTGVDIYMIWVRPNLLIVAF